MSKSKQTPEAPKPLRLFVNPISAWTDLVLKSGGVVLASMQAAAARAEPKAAPKAKPRTKAKRRTKARRR
jgi:hypothetical protein